VRKLLALAVVLAVCLVPLVAWGWPPFPKVYNGPDPKNPAFEVEAWKLVGGSWVSMGTGNLSADARCYAQNPVMGSCNKQDWVVDFTIHASVAQWIEWSLSGSRWDWRVRKPGTYAADCITASIKSNNAVNIFYDGFEDLVRIAGPGGTDPDVIEVWYAFGPTLPAPTSTDWRSAASLNRDDDGIPDTVDLHEGLSWKLWNKIVVDNSDSSCEYEDTATVTLSLTNMKNWIDPTTGDFKPYRLPEIPM